VVFNNFHNSLNSIEYQYSVHNSLLTFKTRLHHRTSLKIDHKRTFQRTLTHFIFFEQCAHALYYVHCAVFVIDGRPMVTSRPTYYVKWDCK